MRQIPSTSSNSRGRSTKSRASDLLAAAPPREGSLYRAILGLLALLFGFLGFAGLFFVPIPEGNREPLLLALGLVLGWGGTVIGYEFGSSPAGRKAADAGVKE